MTDQTRKSPEEIAEMLWIEIHKDDAKRETQIHRLANFIQSERNQRVSVSMEAVLELAREYHNTPIWTPETLTNAILSLLGGTK